MSRKAVTRRRFLKPTEALLVGRLHVVPANGEYQPFLGIDVWCPFCHREHSHGWEGPEAPLDAVSHRVAHCQPGTPLDGPGYYIGLDPAEKQHNREAIARLMAMLARTTPPRRR
jgi:hypothetical protein